MYAKIVRRALQIPCSLVPGYKSTLRRAKSSSIAIVMYHGVTALRLPVSNWCQLAVREFEKQVEFLAKEYHLMHLDEVIKRIRLGLSIPKSTACLTFDDGFLNVATTAFPILRRLQMPATVFLVTGTVGTGQPAWPDRLHFGLTHSDLDSVNLDGTEYLLGTIEQKLSAYAAITKILKRMDETERKRAFEELMSTLGWPAVPKDSPLVPMGWEEVDQLSRTGLMKFGSHTHTHSILSRCQPETQRRELELSRDILVERGLSAELFAYPNGTRADFTDTTKRILAELGYHGGVTTIPGLNSPICDPFELRRVNVGDDTTLSQFEMRLVAL